MRRETGIYVGKATMLAATARGETLRRQMAGGPLDRLRAMFALVTGILPAGVQPVDKDTTAWCRSFLRGLGHDPDTHMLSRKRGGLLVRGPAGEPKGWYSRKRLDALQCDSDFLAAFSEAA